MDLAELLENTAERITKLDDPWYGPSKRLITIRNVLVSKFSQDEWKCRIVQRAFVECLYFEVPDKLAQHFESIVRGTIREFKDDETSIAPRLAVAMRIRSKALALGLRERNW
jgi:hypothetical protein